ncbi:MAG: UDP-forming cellulose synthase catalytic subunit [Richelia sp. RM2_1_2]|nr:UDP-forming cellulose synthase catalytic subunit [Richelia sp. SM1_7_0]NJN10726.1 UDP-forming cellulose synthase catalytic subunit [Richelia sp. RM1_1_1]NJO27647.1 UDP-forming cellulose synthase catalytic subunit [Richelia sp. SL_2_1]NJO59250.1 UDP-forming cellulose synthase catalytic subunit [Richelia sp. RM2_1_2]
MSDSLPTERKQKRNLFNPGVWLTDLTPQFFDRFLDKVGLKSFKWLIGLTSIFSLPLIVTPLELWQQAVVAVFLIILGQLVVRAEKDELSPEISHYYHLFMVWLSLVTTTRYLFYRTSYTLNFNSWVNSIACIVLFIAELYAILTLVLAYFQTLKLKERQPISLAQIPFAEWFSVDIYIPTYNEDVGIVRKTALAALACEYPRGKKKVYILDDGRPEKYLEYDSRRKEFAARREELRKMCVELGCILLTRDNNNHAKAGNINHAFQKTAGDLVLILDCDHIPSRQFLLHTVGFFYDSKVSFVQTPHWFYNPDPFERNLLTSGKIPVNNELFYKVIQKGNDFWNASFFCGSAAVIRKSHVLEIGGIAVETVTEDCHTALRLHSRGYKSIYYDKIMIAGLAPETYPAYLGQQMRWARGMAQILRLENPLFNPKLKLTIPQRLCYFSATSHFLYGFPRIVYAIIPTLFLLFGVNPVRGLGLETLAYAIPHIILSLSTNYIIHKNARFSFWNEVFEFVMSFQVGWVTLIALINPKFGSFNVTDKGVNVTKRSFDWKSMLGLIIVAVFVVLALVAVPYWVLLRPEDWEAVFVNTMWCVLNLILVMAALLVAYEKPQIRKEHRLQRCLPVTIFSYDQTIIGETINISETGALIALDSQPNLPDEIEIEITGDYGKQVSLTARIIRLSPISKTRNHLAINFVNLTQLQKDNLSLILYSDVKEWYSQKRKYTDRPIASLGFIATSLIRSLQDIQPVKHKQIRKEVLAFGELYLDGDRFTGTVTDLGVTGLRLKLDSTKAKSSDKVLGENDLYNMQTIKPPVGLLLSKELNKSQPSRFIAEVETVQADNTGKITVELKFPDKFKDQQVSKIRQLLKQL